jgi:hypothetical protein
LGVSRSPGVAFRGATFCGYFFRVRRLSIGQILRRRLKRSIGFNDRRIGSGYGGKRWDLFCDRGVKNR